MKTTYLTCHHGFTKNHFSECPKCIEERNKLYSFSKSEFDKIKQEDKRIPIYRGCGVGHGSMCFCSGRCKEIIGYRELE